MADSSSNHCHQKKDIIPYLQTSLATQHALPGRGSSGGVGKLRYGVQVENGHRWNGDRIRLVQVSVPRPVLQGGMSLSIACRPPSYLCHTRTQYFIRCDPRPGRFPG